jgi:CRP/FNR family transcriptional regulator, dissimilatory nitrate respiration regulator
MMVPVGVFSDFQVRATERDLKPGQTLFRAGQRTIGPYLVLRGRVRLARVDRSGREIVLYTAGSGDMIAEASLFSPVYHCDAIALTPAKVRRYPKDAVLAKFKRDPDAAKSFMTRLARQVMDLRTRMELRNIRSARERVRRYLALNAGPDGLTVAVNGTLKELAAELGLTHEALYRTLARMAAKGEIKRLSGKIVRARANYAARSTTNI